MSTAVFSYAQAARGVSQQPSPQLSASTAPPSTTSQAKDDTPTSNTSATAPSVASSIAADGREGELRLQGEGGPRASKQDIDTASLGGSASSTVSAADLSAKASRDSDATTVDSQNGSEGKTSRSASRTSRLTESVDGRRPRKGKKGRANEKESRSEQKQDGEQEKEKEAPKPVVLCEAPIPAVNPWKKVEAPRSAAKPVPVSGAVANGNASSGGDAKQTITAQESNAQSGTVNSVNGEKLSQKKSPEAPRSGDTPTRRSGPRGSRALERDDRSTVAPPPVVDASSWPDPKAAAATKEQTSRKVQEKQESAKQEAGEKDEEPAGPTRKKTWEKLAIVPSVVFETQLPPRGSKPRGGARGGREAGSFRGGHAANTANPADVPPTPTTDKVAVPTTGAAPLKSAAPRPRDQGPPTRVAPQGQSAHASKRTSVDGASKDQRKPSVSGNVEHVREPNPENPTPSTKRGNPVREGRGDGPVNAETVPVPTRLAHQERTNNFHSGAKDGGHSNMNGQHYPGREGRSDRGGRGGFRNRGGHNGSGSHLHSSGSGYNGHGNFVRPPASQHNPPAYGGNQFPSQYGQASRGRGNKWAGSVHSVQRNGPNAAPFVPAKMPPVNDFAVGAYPDLAIQAPVNQATVMLLREQVEYYFSVENLCKDMFLRQHMDGQGFVHLATIAGFKRVRALTQDVNDIRLACALSEKVELIVGEDHIERIRSRGHWQSFILPLEGRLEDYRNEGPSSWSPVSPVRPDLPAYGALSVQPLYPATAAPMYPGYAEEHIFQQPFTNGAHYDAGMNGGMNGGVVNGHLHGPDSRLNAVVAEFAPLPTTVTLESMTNFPDSKVKDLLIIVPDNAASSDIDYVVGYVSLEHQRHEANGTSSINGDSASHGDPLFVWLNGQRAATDSEETTRRRYDDLRKEALDQREKAKPGETPKDMQKLYKFWSQMLLNDFNDKIYTEFRELALQDAADKTQPRKHGIKYLVEFYQNLLYSTNSRKPWPQDRAIPPFITLHFNEASEVERSLNNLRDSLAI